MSDSNPEKKRHPGVYRAVVRDNKDPEQLKRVKLEVPEVLGPLLTDWAYPGTDTGGGLEEVDGGSAIPSIGAHILVQFESGDVNRPLYMGAWWGRPKGKNHVPKLVRGQRDESAGPPKGVDITTSGDYVPRPQPQSPYAAKYPFNRVIKSKNGKLTVELDDTPGAERIHVFHGPSKSWLEMDVMGKLSVRAAGGKYEQIDLSEDVHVLGPRRVAVEGIDALRVAGNQMVQVMGDRQTVVFGNDTELIMGTKFTNVLQFYARMSGMLISDLAPAVSHNG